MDAVLEELGAGDRPRLLVYNKLDLLDEEERRELLVGEAGVIGVSAATGEGLDELRGAIAATFEATLSPLELLVPYEDGAVLSELHALAGDLEREDLAEGVAVKARVPAAVAHRFAEFATDAPGANGSTPD